MNWRLLFPQLSIEILLLRENSPHGTATMRLLLELEGDRACLTS